MVARMTCVVAPLMLLEAGTALLLVFAPPPEVSYLLIWGGAALLAIIWLSTALLQIPLHRRLSAGWDPQAARRLVATQRSTVATGST